MCATCGCGVAGANGHDHHDHDHHHHHHEPDREAVATDTRQAKTLRLEVELLAKNNRIAAANRLWLRHRRVLALNLIGAPGAGKTSLLEATARELTAAPTGARSRRVFVIEGDQATSRDADRIREAGLCAEQVNTGAGCHLDAMMVRDAATRLDPPPRSVLFIENVGNLVCPALFDLGERAKVVVASVTEGEDKPEKYPHVFRAASALVLTKIDLVPYLSFDTDEFLASARRVNPRLKVMPISATHGAGMRGWFQWLRAEMAAEEGRHVG